MMTEKLNFKDLEKQSSRSYHQQKSIIKKLLAGQSVSCVTCQQKLTINLPNDNEVATGISCQQGCTDIALDFA